MPTDTRSDIDKVTEIQARFNQAKLIRQDYEALIDECIEFTYPGRLKISDTTKGKKAGATIYDSAAGRSCNLFGDGMHGYLFSPGWLKLKLPNTIEFGRARTMRRWSGKRADEIPEVAEWLVDSQDVMHAAFTRSNFYSQTPGIFKDWGCIGNVGVYAENDIGSGRIGFTVPHIRELYISRDGFGNVDGLFRDYKVGLSHMVKKFGQDTLRTKGMMADIENQMKTNPYQELPILHAVYKRENYDMSKLAADNKQWASMWIYNNKLLLESGYDIMPWVFWTATRNNNEWYGRSLVSDAIVDILTANQKGKTNLRVGQTMGDPPYAMMESLRGRFNRDPGGNTYLKANEKAPEVMLGHIRGMPFLRDDLDRTDSIIREHLRTDVFMMMNRIAMENKNLTATQIVEMAGEKAAVISPITEGAESGLLNPVIDITWYFEDQAGRIPAPPEVLMEYAGAKIEVDYYGPLSQARRRFYKSQGIRAGIEDIKAIAELAPQVLDIPDFDKLGRYVVSDAFPADCVKSDDAVAQARKAKAQQIEQEKVNQGLVDAAKAVPGLGKKIDPESVMGSIMGGGNA